MRSSSVGCCVFHIEPILLSPHDSSIIFASSVVGVAVFSLPVACLLYRFGIWTTFPVLMVVSALATELCLLQHILAYLLSSVPEFARILLYSLPSIQHFSLIDFFAI
ncbi:unnamed protein product [Brugia pahangi]|uniref:Transmembrane protein n=1 Tax=Brugia pahangi TaxID=6280 RepID=A0A0N4SZN5_BRUPA|nr:unnamed protein product [Brugia pahangi]